MKNTYFNKQNKIKFLEECGVRNKKRIAKFLCHCGNSWETVKSRVKTGEIKSCGCLSNPRLEGKKFNRLLVVEKSEKRYSNGDILWKCRCECGNYTLASSGQLKSSTGTKSCGCLNQEKRKNRIREKHPNWNSNLTDEERKEKRKYEEYYEWRKFVFERDNYVCVVCGKRGNELNAHHLDGFSWSKDKRIDINNGVTLCSACHDDFHLEYGNRNSNKEDFFEYWMEENDWKISSPN